MNPMGPASRTVHNRKRQPFAPPLLLPAVVLLLTSGCRSTDWHRKQADRQVNAWIEPLAAEHLQRETAALTSQAEMTLRQRLLLEQQLPGKRIDIAVQPPLATPFQLTLTDALRLGASNSRDYRNRKEAVFRAALNLDVEADAFRSSWAGTLTGDYREDHSGEDVSRGMVGSAQLTGSRLLAMGASVTTRLAVDLAKLLTLDRDAAYGILADASITIPLLKGAGRRIIQEPVTQAEQAVIYAMYDFERYKRSFAVTVAAEYLGVLERGQQILNAEDNYRRLELSTARAKELAAAGRLPAVQVDQTRQDLLRARERLLSVRQEYQKQLDGFKRTLGLPVDANVSLDKQELERLAQTMPNENASPLLSPQEPGDHAPAWRGRSERELIQAALDNRLDLRKLAGRIADAERAVITAADALQSSLNLETGASYGERRDLGSAGQGNARIRPEQGRYRAVLSLEAPWRRVRQRNRYREALLDLERAQRDYEEQEDVIKQQIRDQLRGLYQAEQSRLIQAHAATLAERRVESTEVFLQAGRAQIRDTLEAQEALVSARNALLAATVRFRIAEWSLQRDLDQLNISDEGLWSDLTHE